ncbi:FLYWCH1 isoform 7, partial [Pongo abelii]
ALRQRERLPTTAQQEDPEKIQVQLCFKTCSPESQPIYGDIKDVRLDASMVFASPQEVSQEEFLDGVLVSAENSAQSWRLQTQLSWGSALAPS